MVQIKKTFIVGEDFIPKIETVNDALNAMHSTMPCSTWSARVCDMCMHNWDDQSFCIVTEGRNPIITWCCPTCASSLKCLYDQLGLAYTVYYCN